jgi:hypothetical protein
MTFSKYAQQLSCHFFDCLSNPDAVSSRIMGKNLQTFEGLSRSVNQLESDIKGEKKLEIVVGMQSPRLWRGGSSWRCRSVVAFFASGVGVVFILPEDDISILRSPGVPLSHPGSVFMPGSAPAPWVEHRDSMNGSTRNSLYSAWDNGNRNEKEVGKSRKDIAFEMSRGGRSQECGLFGRW